MEKTEGEYMQQKGDTFAKQTYSLPRCLEPILDDEEEEHVDEKQVQLDVDRSLNAYPQGKEGHGRNQAVRCKAVYV